jgi:hypothetical protein
MKRTVGWAGLALAVFAIGGSACGGGAPASAPPAAEAPPAVAPVAPAAPAQIPAPAAAASAANPCATPGPQTIELEAGVIKQLPWGLEITYAIDDDKKHGPGYMFLLRSGTRRWETRRNDRNWTQPLTWRGFCWRGAERPEKKASRVKIDLAPVCKDGVLQELGGCGDALAAQ